MGIGGPGRWCLRVGCPWVNLEDGLFWAARTGNGQSLQNGAALGNKKGLGGWRHSR